MNECTQHGHVSTVTASCARMRSGFPYAPLAFSELSAPQLRCMLCEVCFFDEITMVLILRLQEPTGPNIGEKCSVYFDERKPMESGTEK
jgi:hypothetical protein